MKKHILMTAWFVSLFLDPNLGWGDSKHSEHPEMGKPHEHEEVEKEHDSKEGHAHDEGEEKAQGVGPEKGILVASESNGIKLSPEALKNFEINTQKLMGNGPWTLPSSARLQSGEETNLFRLRNGFFKRIDFTQSQRNSQQFVASSQELRGGDEVVVAGVGYLRIAEVTAFGGAPEGHSH